MPKVYVKWDADGYRLPTPAEWLTAAGGKAQSGGQKPGLEDETWIGENSQGTTHDVGSKTPNENGLYDMFGNVWEYTWDVGKHYVPSSDGFRAEHTVLGGDFNYPADPRTKLGNPYGDEPHRSE